MVWSVMAAADEDGRAKLDALLRDVEVSCCHYHDETCCRRVNFCSMLAVRMYQLPMVIAMSRGLGIGVPFRRVCILRPLSTVRAESCCHSCDTTAAMAAIQETATFRELMMTRFVFPTRNERKQALSPRAKASRACCLPVDSCQLACRTRARRLNSRRARACTTTTSTQRSWTGSCGSPRSHRSGTSKPCPSTR